MQNNESANEQSTGRKAYATDFTINVKSAGQFRFARRTMRDEFHIGAEYSRLTEGVDTPTPWLDQMASMVSQLKVLAVSTPSDWDIDIMDPLDDETYRKISDVYTALRLKESSFRQRNDAKSEESGQGSGEDAPVLVQEEISANAD